MRRNGTNMALILLIGALVGFAVMWIATDLVRASRFGATSLKFIADYVSAAVVLFSLGAALGCWHRTSWVFVASAVFALVTDLDRFLSKPFWMNVMYAPLFAVAYLALSFVLGIALGRLVRVRTRLRETSGT